MSQLVPHLLLRTDAGASHTAALLRTAGYMVSRIDDDAIVEQLAGAAHVDGVVVELPAMAAIAIARRIDARYGQRVAMLIITSSADTVRRAMPSTPVLKPAEVDDDLVSMVDLSLVAHQMRLTG
jgi:response regulator RpfG family c-di-GMP phosphodiesterase